MKHCHSLISSTTSGSHSLYLSSSASRWVLSFLKASNCFSKLALSFCASTEPQFKRPPGLYHPCISSLSLTVSCRPSLAFSTAFCSESLRCLAWLLCKRKAPIIRRAVDLHQWQVNTGHMCLAKELTKLSSQLPCWHFKSWNSKTQQKKRTRKVLIVDKRKQVMTSKTKQRSSGRLCSIAILHFLFLVM